MNTMPGQPSASATMRPTHGGFAVTNPTQQMLPYNGPTITRDMDELLSDPSKVMFAVKGGPPPKKMNYRPRGPNKRSKYDELKEQVLRLIPDDPNSWIEIAVNGPDQVKASALLSKLHQWQKNTVLRLSTYSPDSSSQIKGRRLIIQRLANATTPAPTR